MAEPAPPPASAEPPPSRAGRWLDRIERVGNALPDPMTLFVLGSVIVFAVSWVAVTAGWQSRLYDAQGELVLDEQAVSLLSADGFRWLITNLVTIFIQFRPLGLVLAAAIGISVADKSGFITAALKAILVFVPRQLLTPATVFAGVMSSMAVDAGYIVLPPLAAAIYKAVGRSPLVGIAAVFAGVGAGFNANLLVTGLDPLLAGLTEAAANILDPAYKVNAACNWFFMIASTVLITFVAWGVTAWYVEPRLARKTVEDGGPGGAADEDSLRLSAAEKRGLVWAVGAVALTMVAVYLNIAMPWGALYDQPGILTSQANPDLQGRICAVAPLAAMQAALPFGVSFAETGDWIFRLGTQAFATWITAIVPLLVILFFVPGMAYGIAAGSIRNDRDVVRMMSEYMSIMGNYIVLAFFAAIFVAAFEHSNLGRMLAIEGGNFLRQFDLGKSVFMVAFIVVVMGINMFVGSMSAKWAMLATVFVPMFMTIGISPELTQLSYRVGDSVTNSISPLNPYIVVILVFMQQHAKKSGLGTLISMMIPYAVALGVAWSLLLVVWINLGIPLGVDGPLGYTP